MTDCPPERVQVSAPEKTNAEKVLEESFYADFAAQAERLDNFALELIKLQLAVAALYAVALRILSGGDPPSDLPDACTLLSIFIPWLLALLLSFIAVLPMRKYDVKPNPIIEPLPDKPSGSLSIYSYFHFSARNKFWWLVASSFMSFTGIVFALISIL